MLNILQIYRSMAGVNLLYMEGRHQPFNIEEVSDILNGNNDDASIMADKYFYTEPLQNG